jgi:uroporphyrinogen-III synthase
MPTTEAVTHLAGKHILVTRPEHQAAPLCRLIEAAGGTPLRLPALIIHDNSNNPECSQRLAHLSDYQIVIFISPNAVNYGLDAIERCGGLVSSPLIATVGKGSARTLEQRLGRKPDLLPEGSYDSEALLQLEPLKHVNGKRILIVRGTGGRELLAETLRERGARIEYAEVYRRSCPPAPADSDWLGSADIITATSGEALRNLVTMTPAPLRDKLYHKPLVVISRRCAELALELGFQQAPRISAMASDEAIVESLLNWAGHHE